MSLSQISTDMFRCHSHNLTLLPSFIIIYDWIWLITGYISTTTDSTSGARTVYPSRAHKFNTRFKYGLCFSIFSFLCSVLGTIVFLFCTFSLATVMFSVNQLMPSDYPYGILDIFLLNKALTLCITKIAFLSVETCMNYPNIILVSKIYWYM